MPINDFAQITTGIGNFYNKTHYEALTVVTIGLDTNDYDFETKKEYPKQEKEFALDAEGNFVDIYGEVDDPNLNVEDGRILMWKNGRGSTGSQYYIIYPDGESVSFVVPADNDVNKYTTVDLRALSIDPVTGVVTFDSLLNTRAIRFDVIQTLTGGQKIQALENLGLEYLDTTGDGSLYLTNDGSYKALPSFATEEFASNPANIVQTATYRLVSDTQIGVWDAKQANLGFTPENVTNKATNFSTVNNTLYPTVQAVENRLSGQATETYVQNHVANPANITQNSTHRFVSDTQITTWNGKQNDLGFTPENSANKATDFSTSNNTLYPTVLAVKNYADSVGTATQTATITAIRNGVASAGDDLNKLYSLIQAQSAIIGGSTADGDAIVNTVSELLSVFSTYSESVDVATLINGKLTKTSNLSDLSDVAQAKLNLSLVKDDVGLNLVPNVDATNPANISQTANYRFVTDTLINTWNGKQDVLTFKTINGETITGSGNIVISSETSGIANVVEDTSPQLGGNLDLNSFTVGAASAGDLTKLNGVTASANELNYVAGVTSAIQTQINTNATAIGTKLTKASNLLDLTDVPTARTNLGLGTLATQSATITDYRLIANGAFTVVTTFTAPNAASVPVTVQLAATPLANAIEVLPNGSTTPLFSVGATGNITAPNLLSLLTGSSFNKVIGISQAAYDALTPDATTLYVITS